MNEDNPLRCTAITRTGNPCKNKALPGSEYCHVHSPGADAGDPATTIREASTPPVTVLTEALGLDEVRQNELTVELDEMIGQIKEVSPDYSPPPFSPKRFMQLLSDSLGRLSPEIRLGILDKLKSSIGGDLFDLDTWKGIWYVLNYTVEYQADFLKRRLAGEYETDEWGLDMEVVGSVRPFLELMYKNYWRVEVTGIENIPDEGRALLVANHSGQLPWDGAMLGMAVVNKHPTQRLVRTLYEDWYSTVPFATSMLTKLGQVLASEDNGKRLLEQGELVSVFPEGFKGISKLYKERYRLARFESGEFVRMALNAQAPLIPVSIVGAEETYISLAKSPMIAKMTGLPFFPISITWPWFGLLGFVPLPTKWYIDIGEPIAFETYGVNPTSNPLMISQLTKRIRNIIQEMVFMRLAQRKSVFLG